MQIRLLGGVQAYTSHGEPLDVGPPKSQAVLAALALSAGSPVPVGRLLELVWGSDPPRTAEKTLQTYVARLRKGLGRDTIVRAGSAYRLDIDPGSVDALRFQRALDAGAVDEALREWTGPPLLGLEADGLEPVSDRLLDAWLGAVETSLGAQLETDPAAAVASLTELTSDHPFRERLWGLLMVGLYRLGRQADALAAYRRAREGLVDELGIEPGPELRALESSILAHDDRLDDFATTPAAGDTRNTAASGPRSGRDVAPTTPLGDRGPTPPTGTVTFGFCTIVANDHSPVDPAVVASARAAGERSVRAAAADHGGVAFAGGGGTVGVAFHHAEDAAAWALGLADPAIAADDRPEVGVATKVGLHTGDARHLDDNYVGPPVDLAARLADAAHPKQTVVSATTAALLGPTVRAELEDLGRPRLDGLDPAGRVWQLGSGDFPPLEIVAPNRTVPVPATALFGRDAEVADVVDLLQANRLITLTGLGGAGKTRLAVAVASRVAGSFPAGVFFASLAPIEKRDEIARVVGSAIGLTIGVADHDSVASFVGSRELLVVLDNCEHVVDGVAELVAAAMAAGGNGTILATSREALEVDGEQTYAVPPLPAADGDSPAVRLLIDRGRRRRPDLDLEGDALPALVEICTRLDGIPLAVELAAAQLAHLTPRELASRLDERFQLLRRSDRGHLHHHQTLQTTMDWSWDLLDDHERSLLRQLSVFAGGWTLPAAEGVCRLDADTSVAAVLRSLVTKSLVLVDTHGDTTRYRMLETVRLYARNQLEDAGATRATRERHAQHLCTTADQVRIVDRFLQPDVAADWNAEIDNVAAVIEWLRPQGRLVEAAALLTMPALLWRFQPAPGPIRRAIRELLGTTLPPRTRAELLIARLDAGTGRGGLTGTGNDAHEVVELGRDLDDDALQGIGLLLQGSPLGAVDPDRAERLLTEGLERAELLDDRRLATMVLAMLAGVQAFGRRDDAAARAILLEAASSATSDGFEQLAVLDQSLTVEIMAGDWPAAHAAYHRLLAFHDTVRIALNWHDAIDDAVFARQLGEPRRHPLATACDRLRAAGGDPSDWPDVLVIPLGHACADGDWPRAATLVHAIRGSARHGRQLRVPHATAFYRQFRGLVPKEALERSTVVPAGSVLDGELRAEAAPSG